MAGVAAGGLVSVGGRASRGGVLKPLESWRLFSAMALVIAAVICTRFATANLDSARGTLPLIVIAVQCALPFFLLAFVTSSVARLWPGSVSGWLLRNRRYFGLAFAYGMAWHFAFVGYYFVRFGDPLNRTALVLDLIGLLFLLALTLTSFRPVARQLTPAGWRFLHKTGVYAIWLLATDINLGAARGHGDALHISMLIALLGAWMLRLAAWSKRRLGRGLRHASHTPRASR